MLWVRRCQAHFRLAVTKLFHACTPLATCGETLRKPQESRFARVLKPFVPVWGCFIPRARIGAEPDDCPAPVTSRPISDSARLGDDWESGVVGGSPITAGTRDPGSGIREFVIRFPRYRSDEIMSSMFFEARASRVGVVHSEHWFAAPAALVTLVARLALVDRKSQERKHFWKAILQNVCIMFA